MYEGHIHVGTWPTGSVFRDAGPQQWANTGQLGEEKEVMGMGFYNGKLYAGTLPHAAVYRYDGPNKWTSIGQLDKTPDVVYRRAWSMAVFNGKLFCGVLPSGHVYSLEAGKCVTYDKSLPSGWQHLAMVKGKDQLFLYLNGNLVGKSAKFDAAKYHLDNKASLKIGFGQHDYFKGKMRDLRLYGRALSSKEIHLYSQNLPQVRVKQITRQDLP